MIFTSSGQRHRFKPWLLLPHDLLIRNFLNHQTSALIPNGIFYVLNKANRFFIVIFFLKFILVPSWLFCPACIKSLIWFRGKMCIGRHACPEKEGAPLIRKGQSRVWVKLLTCWYTVACRSDFPLTGKHLYLKWRYM